MIVNTVEEISDEEITISPNPFKEEFMVSLAGKFDIELFDYSGRRIMSKMDNENEVKVKTGNLAEGYYLVRINKEEKVISRKIIKN